MPAPTTQKRVRTSQNAKKRQSSLARQVEKQSERQIQGSICQILDVLRLPYSVTDASRVFGVDGRVRRSKVATGWPDITGCTMTTGRFFCIEVKRPGGRLSAEQKLTLERLRNSGAAVCVAYSVDEAVDFLKGKGELTWQQQLFLSRWQSAGQSFTRYRPIRRSQR